MADEGKRYWVVQRSNEIISSGGTTENHPGGRPCSCSARVEVHTSAYIQPR